MNNKEVKEFESMRDTLSCEELKKKAKFQVEYLVLMISTNRYDEAGVSAAKLMILLAPKQQKENS